MLNLFSLSPVIVGQVWCRALFQAAFCLSMEFSRRAARCQAEMNNNSARYVLMGSDTGVMPGVTGAILRWSVLIHRVRLSSFWLNHAQTRGLYSAKVITGSCSLPAQILNRARDSLRRIS